MEAISTLIALPTRQTLPVQDATGCRIDCLAGSLWITQENDTRDIVLTAGQRFTLDRPGLALLSSPGGTRLRLVTAERPVPLAAPLPGLGAGLQEA